MKQKIKVAGPYPPGIANFSHQKYAVSGGNWVPVPDDTTLDDLEWVDTIKHIRDRVRARKEGKEAYISKPVESKRTGEIYQVERKDGQWSCTCDGFMYRRKCSHIKKIQDELAQ